MYVRPWPWCPGATHGQRHESDGPHLTVGSVTFIAFWPLMAAAVVAIHNKIRSKLFPNHDLIPLDPETVFVENLPPPEQRVLDLVLKTLLVGYIDVVANRVFTAVFAVELFLNLYANWPTRFTRNGWNWLDCGIVFMSLITDLGSFPDWRVRPTSGGGGDWEGRREEERGREREGKGGRGMDGRSWAEGQGRREGGLGERWRGRDGVG